MSYSISVQRERVGSYTNFLDWPTQLLQLYGRLNWFKLQQKNYLFLRPIVFHWNIVTFWIPNMFGIQKVQSCPFAKWFGFCMVRLVSWQDYTVFDFKSNLSTKNAILSWLTFWFGSIFKIQPSNQIKYQPYYTLQSKEFQPRRIWTIEN